MPQDATLDPTERPSVGVVIPVRNAADRLRKAVDSVLAQTEPVTEIVIALAPSDDGTEELAHLLTTQHSRVCVVSNPTGRTPNGLNLAIAACSTDVIARVDAGSQLGAGYIERALDTLLASGAANVGAVQHSVGETPFENTVASAMSSRFGAGNAAYRVDNGEPRQVDTAWLGFFWRSALEKVGGYDNRFTRNQDYELNWRLGDVMNGVWLDPALRVDYRPRSDLRSLASQYWQYGWWRAETIRKHPHSVQPRQMAAPALVVGLAASALGGAFGLRRLAMALPVVYSAATVAAAATAPGELSLPDRARALTVFPTMHLSWGSGLLVSALRRGG